MRRMITSKKEQQLLDMTESVFESGTWLITSGTTNGSKTLKKIESGYQYKIYLNLKTSAVANVSRIETEIGVSSDYINFIGSGKSIVIGLTALAGLTSSALIISYDTASTLTMTLSASGTSTADISFRYLITRSKLYF